MKILVKSNVRAHTRTEPSGKVVPVRAYTDRRTKKAEPPSYAHKRGRFDPGDEWTAEEREIALNKAFEQAVVYGDEGLLAKERGIYKRVRLTPETVEILKAAPRVFSHSHPSGLPFSHTDILTAAELGLREMRAVTSNGTLYRLLPAEGKDRMGETVYDAARVYAAIHAGWAHFAPKFGIRETAPGPMTIDADDADAVARGFLEAVIGNVCAEVGWRYRVVRAKA